MSTQTTTTEAASGAEGTERHAEAPIYEAFARFVGDADKRASDFRMFATGYHAAAQAQAPGLSRKVDQNVWKAAQHLDDAQLAQPEWLWFADDGTVGMPVARYGFGRWAKIAGQAPYVRADIALAAAPVTGTEGSGRDFELMLARIIHRHGKGLDLTSTIAGARDLLARKGSLSPLRDDATAPQPAGAERVDLGELERLSAAATPGLSTVHEGQPDDHGLDASGGFTFCLGKTRRTGGGRVIHKFGFAEDIYRDHNPAEWAEAEATIKLLSGLWNAYRSGHLVPASLPAALGSGEGTAGACPMGSDLRPSDYLSSGFGGDAVPKPSRKLCPSCQGERGGFIGESGGSPDWDDCWTCGGEGFVTEQQGAHPVFDKARTSSDPYDDRDGPWYDMKRVRQIEKETGIAFAAPCDGSPEGDSAVGVAEAPHPQSPSLSEVEAKAVLTEPYLIRKGGYYYRPNRSGYTATPHDAGHYTREEAEAEAAVEPWHMSAVKLSEALATLTASQEQDGEVRS